ncbi:MAG TPA: hypothetical protein PLY94_02185 [Gemmatimonadaceae bacterium]|nr:hypothetical protein [Gemmatimonadaceae bacterium]
MLLLILSTATATGQLRVAVVDSADIALLGARVELWGGSTLITVRATDPDGIASFTAAESPRATDVLVRNIGFAPRRVSVIGATDTIVVRLERLAQSLPAVTVASVARSCPQSDQPEARALWRRVANRYREPSYESRNTMLEQRQGTVDERDVGFFYDAELRLGSRFYTSAGMRGGHHQLERRRYVTALDSTHALELFGGWRYPAIEAELAGHFATDSFAVGHTIAVVARTAASVTLRFCARDRRGTGLDGTLLLSERDGFVEARWRFWNPRDETEQAGGAATFASASAEDEAVPLTSTSGLFWRRLPSGKFIQRWQRFHEWRLVEESQEASEELLASTCNPPPTYVLCSGERAQFGTGWISSCNSLPYRCFHE